MTDRTMLEELARALCRDEYPAMPDRWYDDVWPEYVPVVRKLLARLRNPTPEMVAAGEAVEPPGDLIFTRPQDVFVAMIDAAAGGGDNG